MILLEVLTKISNMAQKLFQNLYLETVTLKKNGFFPDDDASGLALEELNKYFDCHPILVCCEVNIFKAYYSTIMIIIK